MGGAYGGAPKSNDERRIRLAEKAIEVEQRAIAKQEARNRDSERRARERDARAEAKKAKAKAEKAVALRDFHAAEADKARREAAAAAKRKEVGAKAYAKAIEDAADADRQKRALRAKSKADEMNFRGKISAMEQRHAKPTPQGDAKTIQSEFSRRYNLPKPRPTRAAQLLSAAKKAQLVKDPWSGKQVSNVPELEKSGCFKLETSLAIGDVMDGDINEPTHGHKDSLFYQRSMKIPEGKKAWHAPGPRMPPCIGGNTKFGEYPKWMPDPEGDKIDARRRALVEERGRLEGSPGGGTWKQISGAERTSFTSTGLI